MALTADERRGSEEAGISASSDFASIFTGSLHSRPLVFRECTADFRLQIAPFVLHAMPSGAVSDYACPGEAVAEPRIQDAFPYNGAGFFV
jgi:hypothetical protein